MLYFRQFCSQPKLLTTYYLLLTLSMGFVLGCTQERSYQEQKSRPTQILKNFTVFESKNGIKIWRLVAEESQIYESKNIVQLKNFTVNFFSENGKDVKAVLKAQAGEIDINKNDFYTKDRTVITSSNETLESSNLCYKADKNKIYGNSFVKLIRKDSIVEGKGIEANPDLSSVIIKENIVKLNK